MVVFIDSHLTKSAKRIILIHEASYSNLRLLQHLFFAKTRTSRILRLLQGNQNLNFRSVFSVRWSMSCCHSLMTLYRSFEEQFSTLLMLFVLSQCFLDFQVLRELKVCRSISWTLMCWYVPPPSEAIYLLHPLALWTLVAFDIEE